MYSEIVSESRWVVRTGNEGKQISLLNSKAEMGKVSYAGISSARSAAVTLLGLFDLMRCRYFICEKGWYREKLASCPFKSSDLEGKRFFVLLNKLEEVCCNEVSGKGGSVHL